MHPAGRFLSVPVSCKLLWKDGCGSVGRERLGDRNAADEKLVGALWNNRPAWCRTVPKLMCQSARIIRGPCSLRSLLALFVRLSPSLCFDALKGNLSSCLIFILRRDLINFIYCIMAELAASLLSTMSGGRNHSKEHPLLLGAERIPREEKQFNLADVS